MVGIRVHFDSSMYPNKTSFKTNRSKTIIKIVHKKYGMPMTKIRGNFLMNLDDFFPNEQKGSSIVVISLEHFDQTIYASPW